jgi:hypothetical protein
MPSSIRPIVTSGALLVGLALAASTQAQPAAPDQPIAGTQTAALPPSDAAPANPALNLPEVTVVPPPPYAPGNGPRPSGRNRIPPYHFSVSPGYGRDVALHPYTSSIGPRASSGNGIPPYHFVPWAGYDSEVSLHPYTSGVGPCAEGGFGTACEATHGRLIKPSRHERPAAPK